MGEGIETKQHSAVQFFVYFDITNAQEFSHIKYFVYKHVHM